MDSSFYFLPKFVLHVQRVLAPLEPKYKSFLGIIALTPIVFFVQSFDSLFVLRI